MMVKKNLLPDELGFVKVRALVIDSLADKTLEEDQEVLLSQLSDKNTDKQGRVYLMRFYNQGKPQQIVMTQEGWEAIKVSFYGGTEKELAKTKKWAQEIDQAVIKKKQVDDHIES